MRGLGKSVSSIVLCAVMAFLVAAPGLNARWAAGEKFNLPSDAQWGKVKLATGEYTVSIDRFSSDAVIRIYRGTQAVGVALPEIFDYTQSRGKNAELVCIRHDGIVTVRALRLPTVGTFYFSLPKQLKTLMAQQPQLIQTVPLEAVGY